jgi:hypothetical protein
MREIERIRWARVIRGADLVDDEYVAAQLGRRVSSRAAVRIYVRRGFQTGFRLNPLFVDVSVGDHLPDVNRVPALYAYLVNDPSDLQVSPLWNAAAYLRRHPERASETGGAVGAAWHRRRAESWPFGVEALPAPVDAWTLQEVTRGAAAAARSHENADAGSAPTAVPIELVAALAAGERDYDESLADITSFVAAGGAAAIAVTGSEPEVWTQVALLARCEPRVRAVLRPRSTPEFALSELLSTSLAESVVVRGPDQALDADTVRALGERASDGHVISPLWLDADGTIAAVGASSEGRILAGHPEEDASGLSDDNRVTVPALAGTTFAAPRALLTEPLSNGDWAAAASVSARRAGADLRVHTDLRTRSRVPSLPAVLPPVEESAVILLEQSGWQRIEHGPYPRLRRTERTVELPDGRRVHALRWALRTAAPSGPRGEWWGDTHFARGLAGALRRLGQEVVVDAYPARNRSTTHLDDVTVVLRGPEPIAPPATGVRMMWIISHPEQINREGLEGFDAVFAASEPWARTASSRFGRDVRPLLQCTDPTRFRPHGLARGSDAVFVGTARGVLRPSVVEPVRAGVPVRVYGPDWRGWIPASSIAGTGVPNSELSEVYESAGVVLNDHWPAMRERGFIANRPFDVVASGGRVISDDVEGLAEHFEGAVLTYRTVDELLALLRSDLDALFPHPAELTRIAARVRERDSFDARARVLLDAALDLA